MAAGPQFSLYDPYSAFVAAINSLVLSYTLSVLYLNGVKSGDYQATFSGARHAITGRGAMFNFYPHLPMTLLI